MKSLVVFDLDGTLADVTHREHLAREKRWDEFNAAAPADLLNAAEREVLASLWRSGYRILILTGRSASARALTQRWLEHHALDRFINEGDLRMRREGDHRPDHEVKPEMLTSVEREHVLCVFEDRDQMVARWRALGLRCFQVQPGSY